MNNNEISNPHPETWKVFVLLIKRIAESKGLTSEAIAERTGLHGSHIRRMFQLKYCPSLQTFLTVLKAVEVNIFFEDRENKTDLNILFEKAMADLGRRTDSLPKN